MINPQVIVTPPKHSLRNLKKFLPKIKMLAQKDGVAKEKKEEENTKKPMTVETIISVIKDEKVNLKL